MEVIIRPTAADASSLVAAIIAKELRAKPQLVLGLATGATMEKVYDELVRQRKEEDLDFSLCRTFNLDEYIGLEASDPRSYRYYMNKHLFSRVNIDLRNTHLPNGMAADIPAECERYEHDMRDCGGIDFQLLGIGRSGHIGFNEPLSSLRSRTREKALAPTTVQQNAVYFNNDPDQVPQRAITMGVGTIMDAHRCVVLATGAGKADIVAKAVEGPITAMVTASVLQLHARCTYVVDEAAASQLKGTEYYRWIFENEPDWREFRRAK
ncbi:MAG: glucosamine-6-phosphate deaminase [Kiritimatiellia bacterium]